MIEADLREFLLQISEVRAFAGSGKAARIRPAKLHQDDKKGIVYTRLGNVRDRATNGRTGYATARIRLDFVNVEEPGQAAYLEAKAVFDAMRNIVDGYRGPMGDSMVQDAQIQNDRDEWDETVLTFVVRCDVVLDYDEG